MARGYCGKTTHQIWFIEPLVIYVLIKMSFRTIDLVLVGRKRES